jgi:hypothetical protein
VLIGAGLTVRQPDRRGVQRQDGHARYRPAVRELDLLSEFTSKGIVIATISAVVSATYMWLRYFVLG